MKRLVFVIVVLLFAMATSAFALPTYTSNTHLYSGGTYGATSIPIWFDDETGNQLFDGDYGGYDWFAHPGGVLSVEDYWARYEQENGYGYGWVAWYTDVSVAYITFDMNTPFTFNQVGVHGYHNNGSGAYVPSQYYIAFSDDGTNYSENLVLYDLTEPPAD